MRLFKREQRNTEAVKSPMDLGYMKDLRAQLKKLDSWPSKEMGERVHKFPIHVHQVFFVMWTFTLFLQFLYIRENQGRLDFHEMGHSYMTFLINVINCSRISLIMTKSYREVSRNFIRKQHLFHIRNSSDFAMEVYNKVDKICRYFSNYLIAQMLLAPFLFNMAPLVFNITSGMLTFGERPVNGTFVQNIYYALPFDYTQNVYGFLIVSAANMWLTYKTSLCICLFDLHLSLLVFHIWGHLTILQHNLDHFPMPSSSHSPSWYTEEESEIVQKSLQQLINHHRMIMEFVADCSNAFGACLAVYFTFHQVCCCILLLQCSQLDATSLTEYGLLTVIIFQQMMQISFVFEILGSKSLELADAVYNLPWECMRVRERRIVLFFLCNVQASPINFKALGLVPVGVRTMAAIIKTSISYFVMLRTFA